MTARAACVCHEISVNVDITVPRRIYSDRVKVILKSCSGSRYAPAKHLNVTWVTRV
jgi:hypothetical protein